MAEQEGHEIAPGGKFREGIAVFCEISDASVDTALPTVYAEK